MNKVTGLGYPKCQAATSPGGARPLVRAVLSLSAAFCLSPSDLPGSLVYSYVCLHSDGVSNHSTKTLPIVITSLDFCLFLQAEF